MMEQARAINKVVLLEVNMIQPNRSQPRMNFNLEDIKSLSESIVANGLLQPLIVRRHTDYFELVSGERRLRALKLAGMDAAPCIVISATDKQAAVFALLENLQRENLNFFEEAGAMKNLITEWGVSQQELGSRLGKAQSTIANKIRLLRLDEDIRRLILSKNLTERHARCLLKLTDKQKMISAIEEISAKSMNVSQTEKYIAGLLDNGKGKGKNVRLIVKDVRIFLNTINHAISLMNESGIKATTERRESDDYLEYTVKIPLESPNRYQQLEFKKMKKPHIAVK